MKVIKRLSIFPLLLLGLLGCRKEQSVFPAGPENINHASQDNEITITEAKNWAIQDSTIYRLNPNWNQAKTISQKNTLIIPIIGRPTFQGVKQGYRKLAIHKNSTGSLSARILEIIPDAYILQEFGRMPENKFSGRILIYKTDRSLESGRIYSSGKITGQIRENKLNSTKLLSLKDQYLQPHKYTIPHKQAGFLIENCAWHDSYYIDGDGTFTIRSERHCDYQYYDGNGGGGYSGGDYLPPPEDIGGGGGSNPPPDENPEPIIPETSNLPGEESPEVDPKKLMDCFTAISNPNAAYQVKILVQEPLPGTSFNIGSNSVGHVAIELTVTSGNQSITQVLGFYPAGTGTSRFNGPSKIGDNSRLEYSVSASYFMTPGNFKKVTEYISKPPQEYHLLNYNCTNFAYQAAIAGGIALPMGYVNVGISGPGGVTTAQTPAGMAAELRGMKARYPNLNIASGGGRAPAGKGRCE